MKKIILFFIVVVGSVFVSCESNTYGDISVVTNPTYAANIGPIVKGSCTGCHAGGGQYPNLENYAEVKEATLNGNLMCRIDQSQACGRVMPQSGSMPQSTIDMFKLWVSQGYAQ